MLDGTEIATLTIDGNEVSVKAEYPDGMYRTVEQVKNMLITTEAAEVSHSPTWRMSCSRITRPRSPRRISLTRLRSRPIIPVRMSRA